MPSAPIVAALALRLRLVADTKRLRSDYKFSGEHAVAGSCCPTGACDNDA